MSQQAQILPFPDIILDDAAIVELMQAAEYVAVDTESGEEEGLLGISFAFRNPMGHFATYLPLNHQDGQNTPDLIKRFWEIAQNKVLIFHNAGHDLLVLEEAGFIFTGRWYDTMIMCHWINENAKNFSLEACSQRAGGMPKNRPPIMQFIIDTQGWGAVPIELMREYSSHDALITLELFYKIIDEFRKQEFDGELWDYEQKFILIVARMKKHGIKIDPYYCMKKIIRGDEEMSAARKKLGFNPGSRKGLEYLLLDVLRLPVIEATPSGKPSFNKKVMEQYDAILENSKDGRAKLVLRFRGFQKTTSANYRAYIHLADKSGILHPNYKLHGTVTGRLSCEKPALQQIPRESQQPWNGDLKRAFVNREGFSNWEFDYKNLEFRLAGAYSEEPLLLEVFNDITRNLFREMAEELNWEYNKTKTFNYSTLYGGGVDNTHRVFSVSRAEASAMIKKYYKKYPKIKEAKDEVGRLARRRNFVRYWSGRRRHNVSPHKSFNSVIQGGAAELVKRAMIRLSEEVCDENCRMLLQVHDSVVLEVRDGMESVYLPKIKEIMETPPIDFGVQFPVDVKPFGGTLESNREYLASQDEKG